ncbi:MAG: GNAT family N-acetyltransferase, partial [Mesorhizobium sp.]
MPRTIRLLASQEVEMLVDWAAGEGWNPGFV